MRWVKLWAVLAGTYLAASLAIGWAVPESPPPGGPFYARLAAVPLAETLVAGWLLSRFRRRAGKP